MPLTPGVVEVAVDLCSWHSHTALNRDCTLLLRLVMHKVSQLCTESLQITQQETFTNHWVRFPSRELLRPQTTDDLQTVLT